MSPTRRFVSYLLLALLISSSALAQDHAVRISNVTGSWPNGSVTDEYLKGGSVCTLEITYEIGGLTGEQWLTANCWQLYSPDGADWHYVDVTRGQFIWDLPIKYTPPRCEQIETFVRHLYKAGGSGVWERTDPAEDIQECFKPEPTLVTDWYTSVPAGGNINGNDTIGFWNGQIGNPPVVGIQSGSAFVAIYVEFEVSPEDDGLHICLDTVSGLPPLQAWEWVNLGTVQSEFPSWDNGLGNGDARCWEIKAPCVMTPEWCESTTADAITADYCQEITYELCAGGCFYPVTYAILPPYNDGNHGYIDQEAGVWHWLGSSVEPGDYDIQFEAYDQGEPSAEPFTLSVSVGSSTCNCCVGQIGDANNSGDDMPTIGDINALIDHLFISEQELVCYPEADANGSGGTYPHPSDITIGDINYLIDYLFITGPENMTLPDCPQME